MAHVHELIDFTVSVFVVYKDKVLVRKHEKYHTWLAVGGHIELNEEANAAALREVKEEVGLDVKLIPPPHWHDFPKIKRSETYTELIPPFLLNIHNIDDVHQHHDMFFVAVSESDEVVPENKDDEWLWLTKEELQMHPEISGRIKNYALTALNAVNS